MGGIMQIISFMKRGALRAKYGLIGSTVNDFLSCWCCAGCHYLQMIHEIDSKRRKQFPAWVVLPTVEEAAQRLASLCLSPPPRNYQFLMVDFTACFAAVRICTRLR